MTGERGGRPSWSRTLAPGDRAAPLSSVVPARALGFILLAGAALGALNLGVDGVLRPGVGRIVYGTMMALLVVMGIYFLRLPRLSYRAVALLIAYGNAVYVVVALTTLNAHLYAGPLMLLLALTAGASFLEARGFVVQLLVVPPICWVGLSNSELNGRALMIQVVVQSGVLILAALLVYGLRMRSERLLHETELMSTTDPLTGLSNRRAVEIEAERLWREVDEERVLLAAFVLDLDSFKVLNDSHGHAAGDEALRLVSRAIRDSAGSDAVVARIGGEEILVLRPVASVAEVLLRGEQLRCAVAEAPLPYPLTASIGVATSATPDAGAAVEGLWRLVDTADMAMYEAKRGGGNRVVTAGELDLAP
ncbi:diguanylate cyclase [Cellulomonas sp. P24]|uniref:GGDEF domain-containing protein n=1 Tax=Cellulomonas sp. P24 TaxID=2885206 RepID=UPI00216AF38D|nr:GGDEF domain-containing protein [Cellulomonas sp. P24]MCR6492956.1 GGDEF domain-containing protein [Cellulomonas sp. P24]